MQVRLVRSGGVAGLTMVATVDAVDLALDQQDVVSRLLTDDLRRGPDASRPGGADQFTYQLEIQEGDRTVSRHWEDSDVDETVRPLLAALTSKAKPSR